MAVDDNKAKMLPHDQMTSAASHWPKLARLLGPGFVVMLADTETGSVITAAQSGAQWGYRLLALQFLIIPILYMAQELTIRLALATGKGCAALILAHFGRRTAWLTVALLMLSCFGAWLTQLGGMAGIGQVFGVPAWATVWLTACFVLAMLWTGSYRIVERVAIGLGLFELAFVAVAIRSNPDLRDMAAGFAALPLGDADYLYLVAANLGTSILPWAIFYQQSAMVDKGLSIRHLRSARLDTLIGAVFCQVVTAAILIAAAATIGAKGSAGSVKDIADIAQVLTTSLGASAGRIAFCLGVSGGALVATIVVCLTCAWTLGEITGVPHSLQHHLKDAPWFYGAMTVFLVAGGIVMTTGIDPVRLSIAVGVANAFLLPGLLAILFVLARAHLPAELRLKGAYGVLVGVVFIATAALGLFSGLVGAFS